MASAALKSVPAALSILLPSSACSFMEPVISATIDSVLVTESIMALSPDEAFCAFAVTLFTVSETFFTRSEIFLELWLVSLESFCNFAGYN